MKILVAYYSDTGNTEKIAKAIFEEVSIENQAEVRKIKEITADNLNNYHLVFVGSPCHAGDLATPVKRLLASMPSPAKFKLAGFFTHMSPMLATNAYQKCVASLERASKDRQVDFKGYYNCQGVPSSQLQELVRKGMNIPEDQWRQAMEEARKHPSLDDMKKAKEFAHKVLAKM